MTKEQGQILIDRSNAVAAKRKGGALTPYAPLETASAMLPKPAKRVRQSTEPILNKLEKRFELEIKTRHHKDAVVLAQEFKVRIANGCWLTVDFFVDDFNCEKPICYEVKGPHAWDDAIVKLKVAASKFRNFQWILVWRELGDWKEQTILA